MASYELEHIGPDDAGVALVLLTGELDLTNADEIVARMGEVANSPNPLVVDLNRLVFIDSAAIHQLFEMAAERARGSLAFVVDPTAPVSGTLRIVQLDRAAPVVASVDEAKALLSSARSA